MYVTKERQEVPWEVTGLFLMDFTKTAAAMGMGVQLCLMKLAVKSNRRKGDRILATQECNFHRFWLCFCCNNNNNNNYYYY